MQGAMTRILLGSVMFSAAICQVQAEALQPDPAWQEGRLANGFQWQILQTPQRPNDRIQIRLLVNTGSLSEKRSETGFSSLVSKLNVLENTGLTPEKRDNLWKNAFDPDYPLPPMIVSYDFTVYNLSLPNNQPELCLCIIGGHSKTGTIYRRCGSKCDSITASGGDFSR